MSVALVTARCSAAQASEPGGSSTTAGLAADGVLDPELADAAGLAVRLHAVPLINTVNPSKTAQSARNMRSA
jgi:hypothetical protein